MGTRKEPGTSDKQSVDPSKAALPHHEEPVPGNNNPAKRDGIVKEPIGQKLVEFIDHDDGFLKVRRALDSADLHLTWTWTVGKHAGRYVYVRIFAWQVGYGLALLMEKVEDVETGRRLATPDKYSHH